MPCLNEADTVADLRREGGARARPRPGSPARSSSPTTARPTARRRSPKRAGAPGRAGAREGLRRRADGRDRRRARSLRDHGRRGRQLRLPGDARASSRSCARETTSCRAAGCPAAAGACCRARCRPSTAGSATRCSRCSRGAGSRSPVHDVYCGLRGFRTRLPGRSRPALHGHGVRDRDDHQVGARRRARSPRCRSPCTPTAARRTRRT